MSFARVYWMQNELIQSGCTEQRPNNSPDNKKMNKRKYLLMALALIAFAVPSRANLIDLGQLSLTSVLGNPAAEQAFIEMNQGLAAGSLDYLNKFDVGTGFDNGGAVASSHFTATLMNGGADATITWDLALTGFQLSYVLVKDGREGGGGPFLYHLYGVTLDQVFNSNGGQFVTINGRKGISHISFFGNPGAPSVPDSASTVALLGLALTGVAVARSKFRI